MVPPMSTIRPWSGCSQIASRGREEGKDQTMGGSLLSFSLRQQMGELAKVHCDIQTPSPDATTVSLLRGQKSP